MCQPRYYTLYLVISSSIIISFHSFCFSCLKLLVTVQNSHDNKREGRGITKMKEVFSRTPDMPKGKVLLNEYYQPVGSRELASVIGVLARKISVQCSDWRLVDVKKKEALWKEIKVIYGVMHSMSAIILTYGASSLY